MTKVWIDMKLRGESGKTYTLQGELSSGGEGTIYHVQHYPDLLAKYYHATARTSEAKISAMVANPPGDPTAASLGHTSISWPRERLYEGSRFVGFLMPRVSNAVPFLSVYNRSRRTQLLWGSAVDWRFLHRTASNYASAVSAIHAKGYIIGDINEGNTLVTPNALISIIDTDSFQVRLPSGGITSVFRCPVGKEEFTAPELQGATFEKVDRTIDHDSFAMGILFYLLLMDGSHPFRSAWKGKGDPPPQAEKIKRCLFPYQVPAPMDVQPPANATPFTYLDPGLQALFRECFVRINSSSQSRPSAERWERALKAAETNLIKCSAGHWYGKHLGSCPLCSTKSHGARFKGVQTPLKNTIKLPARPTTKSPPPVRPAVPAPPVTTQSSGTHVQLLHQRLKLTGAGLVALVLSGWLLAGAFGNFDAAGSQVTTGVPPTVASSTNSGTQSGSTDSTGQNRGLSTNQQSSSGVTTNGSQANRVVVVTTDVGMGAYLRASTNYNDYKDNYILREGSRLEVLQEGMLVNGREWLYIREISSNREGYLPAIFASPADSNMLSPTIATARV